MKSLLEQDQSLFCSPIIDPRSQPLFRAVEDGDVELLKFLLSYPRTTRLYHYIEHDRDSVEYFTLLNHALQLDVDPAVTTLLLADADTIEQERPDVLLECPRGARLIFSR